MLKHIYHTQSNNKSINKRRKPAHFHSHGACSPAAYFCLWHHDPPSKEVRDVKATMSRESLPPIASQPTIRWCFLSLAVSISTWLSVPGFKVVGMYSLTAHLEAFAFLSILFSYCSSDGFGAGSHLLREPSVTDSHSTAVFLGRNYHSCNLVCLINSNASTSA